MAKPPSEQQQQQMFLQQPGEINPNPLQSTAAIGQIQQQPTRKRPYNGGSRKKAVAVGEIVEVQGGHIIRSTGRKDRHSKVCTAKGPRDRRVRLSAHTAIQFYDIQDRLGYDRPSKAVDWLLKKAQSSIDELDKLPPWKPTATNTNTKTLAGDETDEGGGGGGIYADNNDESSSLFPPSMDSDSIAASTPEVGVQFQSYPALDRCQSQDLKLSLQSQNHYRNQQSSHQNQEEDHQSIGFNSGGGWDVETSQPAELGRFQRLIGSNLAGGSYIGNGSGLMFIPPPPLLFGHGVGQAAATNFFSQRGTLQSNNTPLVTASDHHHQAVSVHPFSGIGFGSSGGGFSRFHIPGRIQGDHEEEEDGNVSNKSSSCSRR